MKDSVYLPGGRVLMCGSRQRCAKPPRHCPRHADRKLLEAAISKYGLVVAEVLE